NVRGRRVQPVRQLPLDAGGKVDRVWRLQIRVERAFDGIDGRDGRIVRERIGIERVLNDNALLCHAVVTQRVFVDAVSQSLIKQPAAEAEDSLAILEWRPRGADARREIVLVIELRLEFVTQAERECQRRAESP